MSNQRKVSPIETYNIDIVNSDDIIVKEEDDTCVTNVYWYPNYLVTKLLVNYCKYYGSNNILEIGPGTIHFPLANTFIGCNEELKYTNTPKNCINIDIDLQPLPVDVNHFDFTYVRHVLEDIQSPDFALKEIIRSSKAFYIETPSPLVEITRGVDVYDYDCKYCGYLHHRYIIWSNMETNTIYMLPKYGIIENQLIMNPDGKKKIIAILNKYPVYWNTYFLYNKNMNTDVNIVMYKHGVNMDILKDYARLIEEALFTSMQSTNYFIQNYKKYLE